MRASSGRATLRCARATVNAGMLDSARPRGRIRTAPYATSDPGDPPVPNAPWLAHYDAGVPASLAPYPDRTMLDYFADGVRERPDATIMHFKGADISYATLDAAANAMAAAFAGLGVKRGDRVAPPPPELSAVPDRRVRRVAPRRGGGAAQPDLLRGGAARPARALRRRDDRRPHSLLRARPRGREGDARCKPRDRDEHQGVPPARCCGCSSRCSRRRRTGTA